MLSRLNEFEKQKDFLICVDSDGTAIDAMNIKHKKCFGPCLVDEWDLHRWEKEVLSLWNEINLYRSTRGSNRFLALYTALCEINEKYARIDDLQDMKEWLDGANSLSNADLLERVEQTGSAILTRALSWSQAVNAATMLLTYEDKKPFLGVLEALQKAAKKADIAIVTSAGYALIREEWEYHKLLDCVDVIAAQEDGSKAECIKELLEKGYGAKSVIMLGDAPSDLAAAQDNGVYFYPVLVDSEEKSWREFGKTYLNKFIEGTYDEVQKRLIHEYAVYF